MSSFTLNVNGQDHTFEADPNMPLLWALRDLLGLTGTKFGCGVGACGSCTVHIDGQAVRSCMTPVSSAAGKVVVTIEGLVDHPLQKAWIDKQVAQCGYCQPGQIMTAAALLAKTPAPTDEQVSAVMSSVLCRCGMYGRVQAAIQQVVEGGA